MAADGWCGSSSRVSDLLCVDESRQHAIVERQGLVHARLPRQLVSALVWNGQFGVQIFFAISGFLITSTTLRRWGSAASVNVLDFYRLRFARIAPLMMLVLLILSVLHLTHVKGFVVGEKTGGLGRALVAALTFHVNLLEARRGYLPASWDVLWSLSVEEMFYLCFPLVCRAFSSYQFSVGSAFCFCLLRTLRPLGGVEP